jgi:trehalose 6-phosphate synthase
VTFTTLTVCSNRGPVAFGRTADGYTVRRTGPNGLVPVVLPGLLAYGGSWVFAARTDADREVALTAPEGVRYPAPDGRITVRAVAIPENVHRDHYETFSVGWLAMAFHYLFNFPQDPNADDSLTAAWAAYQQVNTRFGEVLATSPDTGPVLVQDYHLLLTGAELRRRLGSTPPLLYFHHVAWCQSDYFGVLPAEVRSGLLRGMLAYDVVGFHSRRSARAFLTCCEDYMPGVTCAADRVEHAGGVTQVVVAPATIDPEDIALGTRTPAFERRRAELLRLADGRFVMVRVERSDLWKNTLRGLLAIEEYLRRHPADAANIWFAVVLTPTRVWRSDYGEYLARCKAIARRINEAHRQVPGGGPLALFVADDPHRPDRELALAALCIADGLFVNPIVDGLNILPKESAVVSENNPVVILSETAGIHEEISEHVLTVNPFDISGTASTIRKALTMPHAERRRRGDAIRRTVLRRGPADWLAELLAPVVSQATPQLWPGTAEYRQMVDVLGSRV